MWLHRGIFLKKIKVLCSINNGDIRIVLSRTKKCYFEKNVLYTKGGIIFEIGNEAFEKCEKNVFYSKEGSIEEHIYEIYKYIKKQIFRYYSQNILIDPLLCKKSSNKYTFEIDSKIYELGIEEVLTNDAGLYKKKY